MYSSTLRRRIREQRILHDVTLELTYGCNLDCFYCYNDREKPGTPLSLAQYRELLRDLAAMETLFLMLTGGEPMLHPHFFEIGASARELGFVTRVRTNGHSLGRRNAERMKREVDPYEVEVSLHGATAEVHDRQTRVPGSFDRLLANLGHARSAGLRCGAVTTPTAWNEHQVDELFALCDALELPLRFQGPVAPRDNGDTSPLAIQPAATTWEKITARLAQRSVPGAASHDCSTGEPPAGEQPALCGVGVAGVDIDPFGNVQACMHLQQSAGNLHRQRIADIWRDSPLFRRARERSVAAARRFEGGSPTQYGAPVFCIAVEENAAKGGCGDCSGGCGQPPASASGSPG